MRVAQVDTANFAVPKTHCPYCALQCAMRITGTPEAPHIEGDNAFSVNRGALCVKGFTAGHALAHPERLTRPLVRSSSGELTPTSWEVAFDLAARAFRSVQANYGRSAAGVFGGGGLTNEKAYLLGKFARAVLRTPHIDYNGRFCMASAAVAAHLAFGVDRGLPFPVTDIQDADVVLLVGANVAETMPPFVQHLEAQRARGGLLVVVDPRRTKTAELATYHLQLTPGSDAALLNGLLHILVRDGRIDNAYIAARTEGWREVKHSVMAYWPERVERTTGVPERALLEVAHVLGRARRVIVLTARGAEQQSQGVANTLAAINLALALGMVGKPGAGYGAITGQGNGQGGREHGQKCDQLPGYRSISDRAARTHIAAIWGMAEADLPGPGLSAYEMLDRLGEPGGVRALFVMGSNIAVSAPNAAHVRKRLQALDCLVVTDFFLSETARLAHIVFPAAQWAEEEGTITNLEGRVLLREQAFLPPPGVKSDIEILHGFAEAFGAGPLFPKVDAQAAFTELAAATQGGKADYSGMTYQRLRAEDGIAWPCPAIDHPGTPRLFASSFPLPSGRAQFHVVTSEGPAEVPCQDYPFFLTTGRVLAQYQSGTQTKRIARLREMAPEPAAEMHPAAARRLGLLDGGPVVLSTRRGEGVYRLRTTTSVREDTLFVPFFAGEQACINDLTNPALDPRSRMPEFKVCAARASALPGVPRQETSA